MYRFISFKILISTLVLFYITLTYSFPTHVDLDAVETDFDLDSSTTVINNETFTLVNCSKFSKDSLQEICEVCYTFQYECPYGEIDNNNITCSRSSGWESCATCSICEDLPSLYPTHNPETVSKSADNDSILTTEEPVKREKRQAYCIQLHQPCGSGGTSCCVSQGLTCQSTSAGRGNRRKTCRYA